VADVPPGPPEGPDPYKILQVDPEADPEVIQAAYRRLAQKFHPDRASGEEAARRMIAINAAWEVLGDPARRAAYDRQRAVSGSGGRGDPGSGARPGGTGARATGSPAPGGPAPRGPGGPAPHGSGWGPEAPTMKGSPARPAEGVSPDWTSGRSTSGSGYDPSTMRAADGHGAAGRPPGDPSGSVLSFGRFAGWSLGEIARTDVEYLEWLDRAPIGRAYREELDAILRRLGRRRTARPEDARSRRGLFRRS
jgi:curved DNA-binding protein CbpA